MPGGFSLCDCNKVQVITGNLPRFWEDLVFVFSALPDVGWVSAKNVNKLTKSGQSSLVIACIESSGWALPSVVKSVLGVWVLVAFIGIPLVFYL